MWFYLFGKNENYPEPVSEIKKLAALDQAGELVYLKLSSRDDAPMKNAQEGETVYLSTRQHGLWRVHGAAILAGASERGETPDSMLSLYGASDRPHWWRRLEAVRLYEEPKFETELGLEEGTLPAEGQAHVVHVDKVPNGKAFKPTSDSSENRLARLTEVMDETWEAGNLTPEQIEQSIRRFRKAHPYGR